VLQCGKLIFVKQCFWLKISLGAAAVLAAIVFFELLARLTLPQPENLAKLKSSSLFLYENKPDAVFS